MALRSLTARWAAASAAAVRLGHPAYANVAVQSMHTSCSAWSSVRRFRETAAESWSGDLFLQQTDPVLTMARTPQTGLSLKQLVDFGSSVKAGGAARDETLIMAARFLHHELPIRFAHRIAELRHLPHGLAEMSSVQRVASWYERSMKDLSSFPVPSTPAQEKEFTKLITDIFERHGPTLVTMARGIVEFRKTLNLTSPNMLPSNIERDTFDFLDTFYSSRIGIRTLIGQHLALHEDRPGYIGMICSDMRPVEVIQGAVDDASFMCKRTFGEAPEVGIYTRDESFGFPYIPSHLHHIVFELMKNSMRGVIETHSSNSAMGGALPPIKVIVSQGDGHEDIVIKVSDEGGGIPRSGMKRIWSYFYTTYEVDGKVDNTGGGASAALNDDAADFTTATPMAGLGYGLPLSRLYARYFGGDLTIISMEGYGTDAYVHLRRVGDAEEPITNTKFV